jgi:hypothetical protein
MQIAGNIDLPDVSNGLWVPITLLRTDISSWVDKRTRFQTGSARHSFLHKPTKRSPHRRLIGLCPWTWCRSWAAEIFMAGQAALVHAAAAGSMRVRSSRIGAMVSRVM